MRVDAYTTSVTREPWRHSARCCAVIQIRRCAEPLLTLWAASAARRQSRACSRRLGRTTNMTCTATPPVREPQPRCMTFWALTKRAFNRAEASGGWQSMHRTWIAFDGWRRSYSTSGRLVAANQSLNLSGAAFWFCAGPSRRSGPGKFAWSFAGDRHQPRARGSPGGAMDDWYRVIGAEAGLPPD